MLPGGVFLCVSAVTVKVGEPHSESHFRKALPITDHTAAFKDLNKHQRQLCDLAFLSEDYNLWSFTPMKKKPKTFPLVPTATFNHFPGTMGI